MAVQRFSLDGYFFEFHYSFVHINKLFYDETAGFERFSSY